MKKFILQLFSLFVVGFGVGMCCVSCNQAHGEPAAGALPGGGGQQAFLISGAGSKYGPYASRPAKGFQGAEYFASDSPIVHWVDDGTSLGWRPIIGDYMIGQQPPAAATFTTVNSCAGSGCSLSDRNGALHVHFPASLPGTVTHFYSKHLLAAYSDGGFPYSRDAGIEAVGLINPIAAPIGAMSWSVFLYNAKNGTLVAATATENGTANGQIQVHFGYWSSPTALTTDSDNILSVQSLTRPFGMRLRCDGSSVLLDTSTDLVNWSLQYTGATLDTVFGTGLGPDSAGIGSTVGVINGEGQSETDFEHYYQHP